MDVQAGADVKRSPSRRKRTPSTRLVDLRVLPEHPATPKAKRRTAVVQSEAGTPNDEPSVAIAPEADQTPMQPEEVSAPEPAKKKAKEMPTHPPSRPDSAYGIFAGTRHGELSLSKPGMSVVERSTQIKDEWSSMSQEAQAPFRVIADAHLARYWREMEAYESDRRVGAAASSQSSFTQSFLQTENAEREQEKSEADEVVVTNTKRGRKVGRVVAAQVREGARFVRRLSTDPKDARSSSWPSRCFEWYFMSAEQRAPFRALLEADKLRFLREVEAYRAVVTAKSAKGS
jgi:hypothetical protein